MSKIIQIEDNFVVSVDENADNQNYLNLESHNFSIENKKTKRIVEQYYEFLNEKEVVAGWIYDPSTNKSLLMRQFRYPVFVKEKDTEKAFIYEIVAGRLEEKEDPKEAFLREVKEETGYDVYDCTLLKEFYSCPGASTEKIHLFIGFADSSQEVEREDDDENALIYPQWMENEIIRSILLDGLVHKNSMVHEVIDSKTLIAAMMVKNKMNISVL